jgi:formate--tetrahydrofolate ligase
MLELADAVTDLLEEGGADYQPLYRLDMTLREKIEMIAGEIYGSEGVEFLIDAEKSIERLEGIGMGDSPVCMAKTQYSFSDNPELLGRPSGFHITVRDVIPAGGAGFVVAKTGDIMTMPGLSARPAATGMSVKDNGEIVGLA